MTRTLRKPPPERIATAAELAGHAARMERARTGRQLPRTAHALTMQGSRLTPCGHCGARPGFPCSPDGDHLARFVGAQERGLLTRAELAAVAAALDVIAWHVVVRGVTS